MFVRLTGTMWVAALLAASGASASDEFPLQQKVNACHAIADRDARIDCYDKLAQPETPAGKSAAKPIAMATPQTGVAASLPSSSVQPNADAVQQLAERQTSESLRSDTDEIQIAITKVSVLENAMVRLVMSDGITWDQTEERHLRKMPVPGDIVTISRSWLGYTCKLSRREAFHCKPPYGLDGQLRSE